MIEGKIEIIEDFFVTQMNYLFLFPAVATVLVFIGRVTGAEEAVSFLPWLPLGLLSFFLYLVRKYCRKFVFFVLLHAGVMAFMFVMPAGNVFYRAVYVILGAGFIVLSLRIKWTGDSEMDEKMHPAAGVVMSGISLFLLQRQEYAPGAGMCCMLLIAALSLFFAATYMENYRRFLKVNKSSASHIPEKEMFRTGLKLTFGYIAAAAAVLAMTANIRWLAGILQLLKNGLLALLRLLVRPIKYEPSAGPFVSEGTAERGQQMVMDMGPEEPSLFWTILEYVVIILLLVGFAYVLGKALLGAFHFLRTHWGMKSERNREDETAAQVPDVKERIQSERRRNKPDVSLLQRLSPDERIRRLYRKQVWKERQVILEKAKGKGRAGDLALFTAAECGTYLDCPGAAGIYEKARYSNRECSAEDFKKMKEQFGAAGRR